MELGRQLQKSDNPNLELTAFLENKNAIAIYTDGSKIKGNPSFGSACICNDLEISVEKKLSNFPSTFTAECVALESAMDIALALQLL